jgi:K+-sensing histidine kinase KdpD
MRTEFVSVVSHQIRAPLTNMHGAVERMQNDCHLANATCGRMLAIQEQQIGRLERLVKDVLNASRIEAGDLVLQPEPVSLLPIVQQVVEQARARAVDRPFRVLEKPGLPLVFADRDRVAEVLANLFDNADKYSPVGGEVVINVRADQAEVTLSVQDSGRGLREQDTDRVFDKFYRADSSDSQLAYGYGLGLWTLITLTGRQAQNSPEGGAIFSFSLPAAP